MHAQHAPHCTDEDIDGGLFLFGLIVKVLYLTTATPLYF